MARYRVYAASIYRSKVSDRSYGLVGAQLIDSEQIDVEASSYCQLDELSIRIKITSGRIVWDENNNRTDRTIWITTEPQFPITDLIGKIIVPYFDQALT